MDSFGARNNVNHKIILSYNNYFIILIISVYLLSIVLMPLIKNICAFSPLSTTKILYFYNLKNDKLFFNEKNIKTNINNVNDTATYIFLDKLTSRQINNDNLQSYINDAKGSVLKLNDLNNAPNNKTYSYDAYGNVITVRRKSCLIKENNNFLRKNINENNNVLPNYLQYNGEQFDSNTVLQYLRARFYCPFTKRFITQDDYDLLNRFGYVVTLP